MNINNLEMGKTYNSFRELCETLNIKPKTNNSKKAQLKEMERHFKSSVERNRFFTITEIYKEPLPEVENKRNLPPYIQYMETLLLQYLQQEKTGSISVSTAKLANDLQMIHDSYSEYYNKKYELSNLLNIELIHIQDFMNTTSNAYKNAINTILSRLEKRAIILYETRWKTVRREKIINDSGKIKERMIIDFATDEEKDTLLNIKYETMKSYGDNMQIVYREGKANEYYTELNNRLCMEMGIESAHKSHEITINKNAIDNEYYKSLQSLTSDSESQKQLQQLSNEIWAKRNIERMKNKVDLAKKNEETREVESSFPYASRFERKRLDANYLKSMEVLNSALIIDGIRVH